MTEQELVMVDKSDHYEYAFGPLDEINENNIVRQSKKKGLDCLTDKELKSILEAKENNFNYEKSTKIIRKNINAAMEAAKHLYVVYTYQLYRQKYNSFKEYINGEFNYTLGRVYQLIRASYIAAHINEKLGWTALTTEAQCRALARLPVIDDDGENEENENLAPSKKKLEAQLKLVSEIVATKPVPPKVSTIVEKVKEVINAKQKHDQADPVFKRRHEIRTAFSQAQKQIDAILTKEPPDVDLDEVKENALEKLKELVAELKDV